MELQMTKDEALKLALEALEASHFLIHGDETKGGLAFCMDGYYSGCFDIDSNDKQANEAITAIKEALAQPKSEYERGFINGMQKQMQSSVDKAVNAMTQPTYYIPNKDERTWVGLTDKEMLSIEETTTCTKDESWLRNVTRAIEAKLKEKNT
jgi:hypothetical protein